jgi:hypothetical protein
MDLPETLSHLGGNYGDFMRLLVTRDFVIDFDLLVQSLSSIGCDEDMLADVLCVCTDKELHMVAAHYARIKGASLLSAVISKTVHSSPFQEFLTLVLQNTPNRDLHQSFDIRKITSELEIGGLVGSKQRNDELIFQILSVASRSECGAISEQLEQEYGTTLNNAIQKKYKGSIARALALWVSPSATHAIARRLRADLFSDPVRKTAICHLVAKYDRNTLLDVLNTCDELFPEQDMENLLMSSFSGNLRTAISSWINSHRCDGDHENAIKEMMVRYELESSLIQNEQYLLDLRKHLDGENSMLAKYVSHHRVDLPRSLSVGDRGPNPNPNPSQSQSNAVHQPTPSNLAHYEIDDENPSSTPPHHVPPSTTSSSSLHHDLSASDIVVGEPTLSNTLSPSEEEQLVLSFLKERFAIEDLDSSGTLGMLPLLLPPSLPLPALPMTVVMLCRPNRVLVHSQQSRCGLHRARDLCHSEVGGRGSGRVHRI